MLKMKEMPYVIGITMRMYPSDAQKDTIAYNDGAARFIYNCLVARHKELFSLRTVKTGIHNKWLKIRSIGRAHSASSQNSSVSCRIVPNVPESKAVVSVTRNGYVRHAEHIISVT